MNMMSKLLFCYILGLNLSANALQDPSLWVKKADEIRNPAQSYEMTVQVQDDETQTVFQVSMKGQDKTLIVTKSPAKDKGRNMLMLDRDFYAFVPNLKRSMRLSLAQKLSGQVANGDISRTRWYGDYDVRLEKENAKEVQLLLKARKKNLTYEWIRLWIQKSDSHPLHAEYLGLNGKTILKTAAFEDYKNLAGAIRPSTIKISDVSGKASFIHIEKMNLKNFDDEFFTTRNMESMQ